MDKVEQKDRAMAPPETPPVESNATPLPAPYRKDFSLTSGAKYLGIGKGTLRAAIERGEVKSVKNASGHYIIEGAQIFQYEKNLEADEQKSVPAPLSARASTRVNTSASTPVSPRAKGGVDTGADTLVGTGDNTPSDRRAGTVSKDMHQTVVESLEARLRDKDGTIRDLKDSVESWQKQAKSWQNHADNNLRLLEDQREKVTVQNSDANLASAEQGGRPWVKYVAMLTTALVLGAGYFYRADIAQQWVNFTASNTTNAVSVESETPQG